jgi:hypothetical protein
MRHLRLLNLFRLIAVAGHTKRFHVGLRQNDFAVLGRGMAQVARLVGEWRMQELPHQLGRCRLMRIVATGAIRRGERLIVMRLLQAGVLHVVTIDAQRRSALGQMKIELSLPRFSGLMRGVAGVASHVEGGVAAAFFGDIQSLLVATQAQILPLVSRFGFNN